MTGSGRTTGKSPWREHPRELVLLKTSTADELAVETSRNGVAEMKQHNTKNDHWWALTLLVVFGLILGASLSETPEALHDARSSDVQRIDPSRLAVPLPDHREPAPAPHAAGTALSAQAPTAGAPPFTPPRVTASR